MQPLILFVIVILAIFAVIKYLKKLEQERSDKLAVVARQLGFKFQAAPPSKEYQQYEHFQLFSEGHSKKIMNLMADSQNHCRIFGYEYSTGSGRSRSTRRFTVVVFKDAANQFTDFDLRPEHIFHKIGKVFGYQDINFDEHPEFSKKYLLQGRNEQAVRQLFSPTLIRSLESNEQVCIEARGHEILFYQPYNRVEPEAVETFYRLVLSRYQSFFKA